MTTSSKTKAPKTPKTPPAPPEPTKTPGITSSQLLNVLTLEGLEGFQTILPATMPSLPVLKKLHQLLENVGPTAGLAGLKEHAIKAVLEHCEARKINVIPSRGRQPPVSGDRRRYRVQQLKEGGPFLRLSLSSLGVTKGDGVYVDFDDGEIKVRRTVAATAAYGEDDGEGDGEG